MSPIPDLVDRYIAAWNETDAARRRDLIAQTWTEDAHYLDPLMQGSGASGIDTMIQGFQEKFPGFRLRRTGGADRHHDRIRFGWELGPDEGPAPVAGVDFGTIASDGRLQSITGFLDRVPDALRNS